MLLNFKDESGIWNFICDGFVVGRYDTKQIGGKIRTCFTLAYNYLPKEKTYATIMVTTWGEDNAKFVRNAKLDKVRLVCMGNSMYDKAESEAQGKYVIRYTASSIFAPSIELAIWNWHKGAVQFDEHLAQETMSELDKINGRIRYDYADGAVDDPSF